MARTKESQEEEKGTASKQWNSQGSRRHCRATQLSNRKIGITGPGAARLHRLCGLHRHGGRATSAGRAES